MPKARFSQVLRGARGQAARTKFLDYLTGIGTRDDDIGTKGNRPNSIPLFIVPFSITLAANTLVRQSALQPSWTILGAGSEMSTRVKTTPASGDSVLRLGRYKAPRVVRRQQSSQTGTRAVSKLTGLPYLKYNTESNSAPFGKKTGDTAVLDVFEDIVTQARGSSTNLTFSLIEEDA